MALVKKVSSFPTKPIEAAKALAAIEIQTLATASEEHYTGTSEIKAINYNYSGIRCEHPMDQFRKTFGHPVYETIREIWRLYAHIFAIGQTLSAREIFNRYSEGLALANKRPVPIMDFLCLENMQRAVLNYWISGWAFNGFVYEINGLYSSEEIRLLLLENFDKERQKFERLKAKFDEIPASEATYERPRIPEKVRIEVWRRDGGKCARCGSRERLEYDHIVPISRGGSNTARNIELLCESCNRTKSNNIV